MREQTAANLLYIDACSTFGWTCKRMSNYIMGCDRHHSQCTIDRNTLPHAMWTVYFGHFPIYLPSASLPLRTLFYPTSLSKPYSLPTLCICGIFVGSLVCDSSSTNCNNFMCNCKRRLLSEKLQAQAEEDSAHRLNSGMYNNIMYNNNLFDDAYISDHIICPYNTACTMPLLLMPPQSTHKLSLYKWPIWAACVYFKLVQLLIKVWQP